MRVGDLCLKLAGRDAGKRCVIIKNVDEKTALIDGETRRRSCNLRHLAQLHTQLPIKENASHAEVLSQFKSVLGLDLKKVERTRTPLSTSKPAKEHRTKAVAPQEASPRLAKKSSAKKVA